MLKFPLHVPALQVVQPLGVYYVTVLPAELLLEVAYSDAVRASLRPGGTTYELTGTQRLPQPKRFQPITDYINRIDSAFPNSIIIAANYREEDGLIEDEELVGNDATASITQGSRWKISGSDNGVYTLIIPSPKKLAAIIDGQHRLFAFAQANPDRLEMDLICSVFIDLPKPYQAHLFATINSTQQPVNKSLTYDLFGYNVNEEAETFWSPDKLAVFLTRKLGMDSESPLRGRIVIAPKQNDELSQLVANMSWRVSTAVVVEGIMRLITTNPKRDSADLLAVERKERRDIADYRKDRSPLRWSYLNYEDAVVYKIVLNYLRACSNLFWETASSESFIVKTVGLQALFDVLRQHAVKIYSDRDIRVARFEELLRPAASIDFSAPEFRNASGSGRAKIRQALLKAIGDSL
ncbi:DGQHR domain-containing protein [Oxalobacteraceae sp. CFBP 8763]|nr:DGQHR domain-containing protein [Oxalobacteraceae sp. CFBP 8763]